MEVEFTPQVGQFQRRPRAKDKWWTPVAPLEYGIHSAHNIMLTAGGMGIAVGVGLCVTIFYGATTLAGALGLYTLLIPLYHMLEYLCVALYNPNRVSMESFMFNPDDDNNYYKAMLISIIEYVVGCWLFPNWKAPGLLTVCGLLMAVAGQCIRTLAMITAKTSFNHFIAKRRENDHQLITHGIYRYERHPSYVGFFCWAVGLQLMLKNFISLLAFIAVLGYFFCRRTRYEEDTLVKIFGTQYDTYRKQTPTLIPFTSNA